MNLRVGSTATVLVILALVLLLSGQTFACVGARPMAMGGAFTGLADDVNATYWNPAGLVQLQARSATWMHTMTNRDEINYQDYLALAMPAGPKSAVGISWISFNLGADEQNWYWASFATKLNDKTSVGINIKKTSDSLAGVDTDMGMDIGIFSKVNEKWTVGLLIQDANEPETSDGVDSAKWVRNWRPGASYRPDDTSVVTMEIYDATDEYETSLRIGYEKQLKDGWAVRCGYYGLGSSDCSALTFGAGRTMKTQSGQVYDAGIAVMTGDVDTILGSFTFNF